MTSNQLNYWRDQETQRSNREQESIARGKLQVEAGKLGVEQAKAAEQVRHNLASEEIDKIANDLKARGLDIQDKQQLLDLVSIYSQYGTMSVDQMPPDVRDQLAEIFGINPMGKDVYSGASEWWEEVKETFKALGGFFKALF